MTRRRWIVAAIGAVALAVTAVAIGVIVSRDEASSSYPNEDAANGPLVGNPALLDGEQQCIEDNPNPPWFETIAAFEVHDSGRTHLYECAHFGGSSSDSNDVLAYAGPETYQTPYNIVTSGPNRLYVYGGGYGDNPSASGSFVSRVEPGTLREVWRRVLINTYATDEWDYPGVLNVMSDGSLVVIYGYRIARIDPNSGDIEATNELPTGGSAPRDTSYNGFDALPDGTIIAKTVNRQKGCAEQGFSAFLNCPDPLDAPSSVLVAIDPDTLDVLDELALPEMMGGRVTTSRFEGNDYIYLPGTKNLYRYVYRDGALAADSSWGPVPYLEGDQSSGSAMAVMGDYVTAMTNGGAPSSTPMSVVAVSQADSSTVLKLQPFADAGAKQSFIPSMVSVDPDRSTIYVMDAGAAKLGAVELKDDKLSLAWSADQRTLSFTTLVGSESERVLVGTNISVKTFKGLEEYTTEQVVWRDAATGAELARSQEFPKMTQGILVTPGYAGLQYFLTSTGTIIELQVVPAP